MRVKGLMIVGALTLLSLSTAKAAEDLSGFGIPVDGPGAKTTKQTTRAWTADVCSEIQRIEKMVIADARPVDRACSAMGS